MASVTFAFRLLPFPILTYIWIYDGCHVWGILRSLFSKHLTLLLGCFYRSSIYLSFTELTLLCVCIGTDLLSTCSVLFVLVFTNLSFWIYDYDVDYGLLLLCDLPQMVIIVVFLLQRVICNEVDEHITFLTSNRTEIELNF